MNKLHIFDVDNTIVRGQSQRLLLSYLYKQKMIGRIFYLRVMIWFIAYKFNIARDPKKVIDYAYSFLNGKNIIEIDRLASEFFEKVLKKNIYFGARELIEHLHTEDVTLILVSNSPSIVVKFLAEYLKVQAYFCTELEIINGIYTGKVRGELMYGESKRKTVLEYVKNNGYTLEDATAYGDHISDLFILEAVGHPIAVNPSPKLAQIARKKHWPITVFK